MANSSCRNDGFFQQYADNDIDVVVGQGRYAVTCPVSLALMMRECENLYERISRLRVQRDENPRRRPRLLLKDEMPILFRLFYALMRSTHEEDSPTPVPAPKMLLLAGELFKVYGAMRCFKVRMTQFISDRIASGVPFDDDLSSWNLLFATYFFDLAEQFQQISHHLVFDATFSEVTTPYGAIGTDRLPKEVWDAMEAKRKAIRFSIFMDVKDCMDVLWLRVTSPQLTSEDHIKVAANCHSLLRFLEQDVVREEEKKQSIRQAIANIQAFKVWERVRTTPVPLFFATGFGSHLVEHRPKALHRGWRYMIEARFRGLCLYDHGVAYERHHCLDPELKPDVVQEFDAAAHGLQTEDVFSIMNYIPDSAVVASIT